MTAALTKLLIKCSLMRPHPAHDRIGNMSTKLHCSISLAALPGLAALTMVVALCEPANAAVHGTAFANRRLSVIVPVAAEAAQPSVDAFMAQGREALRARKPDDALSAFDSVIALDAANPRALFYRGAARMQKQDRDGALADVEKALSIDPGYAEAYRLRAVIWSIKKDNGRAIQDFNHAIELDPKDAMAYFARGIFMANAEKNHAAAIEDFGRTISANPRYVEAYMQRGQLYEIEKQFDLAFADYDAAVRADPNNSRAYTKRGETWLRFKQSEENFDRAIADFEQAARLSPDDPLKKVQLQATVGMKELFRTMNAEKK
jgi:tetratricopeptide (TPR) repeat protein